MNIDRVALFSSPPTSTDWPPTDCGSPPRRQCSERLSFERKRDPAELQQLTGREVGRERLDEVVADERQLHEGAGGDELVRHRLDDRLLPLAAREVVLGRVEPVLTDARVDQRALAAHRLPALAETPALPFLAARLGRVRAVEAVGEDRLRHVDLDPAERVDHLPEVVEVDEDDVVRLQAGQRLNGLHRQRRPTELEGGVDLVRPLPGDVHAEVARDRQIRHPVPLRVGADEQDRVGAAEVLARRGLVAVGAEQHDQRRIRQQQAVLRREARLHGLRQPRVRLLDAAAEGQVAGDQPDEQQDAQHEHRKADPPAPPRLAGPLRAARLRHGPAAPDAGPSAPSLSCGRPCRAGRASLRPPSGAVW